MKAARQPKVPRAAFVPFAAHVATTRRALAACLDDGPAGPILRPYFERGKMLRAHLVFAAADAVGGRPSAVAAAAQAIELLHTASLFHDDIIDGAARRRGLPALHERLGVGPALVVGDDLILRAFAALAAMPSTHPSRMRTAAGVLNKMARRCCRGQYEELNAATWIPEARYLEIARGKTSAPFIAAATLGAMLAGGTRAQIARIGAYADELGVAFQIADDLLDLIGDDDELGKPLGNSLARARPTLPLVYLWRAAPAVRRAAWQRKWPVSRSRWALVRLLHQHGVLTEVLAAQASHASAAVAALGALPGARGAAALRALAMVAAAPPVRLAALGLAASDLTNAAARTRTGRRTARAARG